MAWSSDGVADGAEYDVVVVGGGVLGAGVAWDAALRGLSVLLVERGDVGGETSAGCFNIVHGGLRYLQHLDLPRLRESAREQSALCRIAAHLVTPFPIAVPCYGFGKKGRETLRVATEIYQWLATERNAGVRESRRLPAARTLSAEELCRLAPGVRRGGLRGGVVFADARMRSSERLVLAIVRSAAQSGAHILTRTELVSGDEPSDDGQISLVTLRDCRSGREFSVRPRVIVNTAGPWREVIARRLLGGEVPSDAGTLRQRVFCRSIQCVLRGRAAEIAVAVDSPHVDHDSVLRRGGRSYFLAPVDGATHCGTFESAVVGAPSDPWTVEHSEMRSFLSELSRAYDVPEVRNPEVLFVYGGVIPVHVREGRGHAAEKSDTIELGGRSVRTGREVTNLVHAAGVKFTTFRAVAERVVDAACSCPSLSSLSREVKQCSTAVSPLVGAGDEVHHAVTAKLCELVSPDRARELAELYGDELNEALASRPETFRVLDYESQLLSFEVERAFQDEGGETFGDLFFRRTTLAYRGFAGAGHRERIISAVGSLLDWPRERLAAGLRELESEMQRRAPLMTLPQRGELE